MTLLRSWQLGCAEGRTRVTSFSDSKILGSFLSTMGSYQRTGGHCEGAQVSWLLLFYPHLAGRWTGIGVGL